MAQRLVRLLFDFNGSFVFMISVYSDVNSFKLFLYVSAYFCLLIGGGGGGGVVGGGGTQTHQDVGGLQHRGILGGNVGT